MGKGEPYLLVELLVDLKCLLSQTVLNSLSPAARAGTTSEAHYHWHLMATRAGSGQLAARED